MEGTPGGLLVRVAELSRLILWILLQWIHVFTVGTPPVRLHGLHMDVAPYILHFTDGYLNQK